ncbi:hypothetical protein BDQ12DRAFT_725941 [Crucibulum laeve]|uniref:F-box domain-containing protein n=1 Tax=Crucibulum laeve TaxID=68775 RepID=A0A5C3LQH1_9AGAR|nr:hypothetical protein BDQ12DRAFT_725941 [Crucibulum laeve]
MSTIPLPRDIAGEIVLHAKDDIPTLKSLALLSHSWLPLCREHLFSSIDFTHPTKLQDRYTYFLSILSRHPYLARHVQSLRLRLGLNVFPYSAYRLETEPSLPDTLDSLSQLEYFYQCGAKPSEQTSSFQSVKVEQALHRILSLPTLSSTVFSWNANLPTTYLSTMRHVKTLTLEHVTFQDVSKSPELFPCVETLVIRVCAPQTIRILTKSAETLRYPSPLDLSHLRHFYFVPNNVAQVVMGWHLMLSVRRSLEYFEWFQADRFSLADIDIGKLLQLQGFAIHVTPTGVSLSSLQQAVNLISKATDSNKIRSIRICVDVTDAEMALYPEWQELEHLLLASRFKSLREFGIEFNKARSHFSEVSQLEGLDVRLQGFHDNIADKFADIRAAEHVNVSIRLL